MRRSRAVPRVLTPDPKFQSVLLSALINKLMYSGKKSIAERIVYTAMDRIEEQSGRRGIDLFEQTIRNVTPIIEVKPRRVGGATYQFPIDSRTERAPAVHLGWLIDDRSTRRCRP